MTLQEAADFLAKCDRYELHDYAFGDSEYVWINGEQPVAFGYKGRSGVDVCMGNNVFKDNDAHSLFGCGKFVRSERNDSQ